MPPIRICHNESQKGLANLPASRRNSGAVMSRVRWRQSQDFMQSAHIRCVVKQTEAADKA
jgi:hypothetical protein